nr:helix-turn-helix domain-containing protein [Bacillus sp. REN3]
MQEVVQILEQVAYDKVEERLIRAFHRLMDPTNERNGWYPLPPYITHKDIAGMIASTRETVTFLINKLIQSGVLKNEENRLWVIKD